MGFLRALLGLEQPPVVKESRAGPVWAMHDVGRPVHTPRNYENFSREAYAANVVAYRCISLVAECAAMIPWVLYRGDREAEGHPFLETLARPNPWQDGAAFREALYSFDLIAGNTYTERMQQGRTLELYAHRPDRIRVVPGANGFPIRYDYMAKGRKTSWDVNPVTGETDLLHVRRFSPLSDYYGQSPLEAIAYSIDQHNAASKWNLAVLQNGAKPSGALKYTPKDGMPAELSDDQYNRLRAELDHMGAESGRSGRPMLLEGGLDWIQMMLTQSDLDWLGGLDKAASYIAQAFNVPEQLVGVPGQQTYNNYKEARQALYEDAVLPMAYRYAFALTEWLVQPLLGSEYRLTINEDDVPALAYRKEQQFNRLESTSFLTINEKREALGYPSMDGGDVLFVSSTDLPLSFAAEPPGIGEQAAPDEAAEAAFGETVPAGDGKVQDQALNGAQIASIVQIVEQVALGQIPADSAVSVLLIAFPSLDEATAEALVAPARDFEPTAADGPELRNATVSTLKSARLA
jgi:HK97 family phage portal protein